MYCCIPGRLKREPKHNWLLSTLIIFSYMVASQQVFVKARSVDNPIGTVKVFLDETATLDCDLHNLRANDHIVWYRKGRYLSDNDALTTQVPSELRDRMSVLCNRNRESCALMIHTSSYDDSGTYKCGFGFINQEDQVVIRLIATGHLVVARKPTTTVPTTTTTTTTTATTTTTTTSPVTTVLPMSMTSSVPPRTRNPSNSSPSIQSLVSTSIRSYNGNADKIRLTQSTVENRVFITFTASPRKRGNSMLVYVLVAIAITMIVFAIVATSFIIKHLYKRYHGDSLQDPEYCNLTLANDAVGSLKTSEVDKPNYVTDMPKSSSPVINKEPFHDKDIERPVIVDSQNCYANVKVATSGALNGRRGRFTSKNSIKYADLDLPTVLVPTLPLINEEATSYADIKQFQ